MNRSSFLISFVLLMAVVFGACESAVAEPTAVPPTSTPAPTPTPAIAIITESPVLNFDAFVAQMPDADIECLTRELGEGRLKELATGEIELSVAENDIMSGCFSNEFVVGFLAGQIQGELGTFSGSSMACAASLIGDLPAGVLADLVIGDDDEQSQPAQLAIQEFVLCLTQDELAALSRVNSGDDSGDAEYSGSRSSQNEQCMVKELGESFADGYGEFLGGEILVEFSSAVDACGIGMSVDGMIARIEDTERKYTISDLESAGFKKSKTYDVQDLDEASAAHYGFYGADPYRRLEYEARFYFSHDSAITAGVEFANEATGTGVSLYPDDQRWQEGLAERRRCDSNGDHPVGRCGFPKYYDYVVAGNMVLMCQGKEALESLEACADLLNVLQ